MRTLKCRFHTLLSAAAIIVGGCQKESPGPRLDDLAIDAQGNVVAIASPHLELNLLYRLGANDQAWSLVFTPTGYLPKHSFATEPPIRMIYDVKSTADASFFVQVDRDDGHIIRSTDGGLTWAPFADSQWSACADTEGIAGSSTDDVAAAQDGTIYMVAECGGSDLLRSRDSGASWEPVPFVCTASGSESVGRCYPVELAVDPADSDRLLVAEYNDGLLNFSGDGGSSWQTHTTEEFKVGRIVDLDIDFASPGFVVALTDGPEAGVLWSNDSGETWSQGRLQSEAGCGEPREIAAGLASDGSRRTFIQLGDEDTDCILSVEGQLDPSQSERRKGPSTDDILDLPVRLTQRFDTSNEGSIWGMAVQPGSAERVCVARATSERRQKGGMRCSNNGGSTWDAPRNAGLPGPQTTRGLPQDERQEPEGERGGCVGGQVYCCAGLSGCTGDVSGGPCLHFPCDEGCAQWVQCN